MVFLLIASVAAFIWAVFWGPAWHPWSDHDALIFLVLWLVFMPKDRN